MFPKTLTYWKIREIKLILFKLAGIMRPEVNSEIMKYADLVQLIYIFEDWEWGKFAILFTKIDCQL